MNADELAVCKASCPPGLYAHTYVYVHARRVVVRARAHGNIKLHSVDTHPGSSRKEEGAKGERKKRKSGEREGRKGAGAENAFPVP